MTTGLSQTSTRQQNLDRFEYCYACGKYHLPPTWPVMHEFITAAEVRQQEKAGER